MTAQEIFDTVWHAMKAQGRQSLNDSGECAYRGADGLKCAVGCLISDEFYDAHVRHDEGTGASDIALPYYLAFHDDLLMDLQEAHDGAQDEFWPEFSGYAEIVAHNHNLTIPENNQ